MKIIGVSAGVVGLASNIDRMVKAIMEKTGEDYEFLKLNDINYSACKGCSWLCARAVRMIAVSFPVIPFLLEYNPSTISVPLL